MIGNRFFALQLLIIFAWGFVACSTLKVNSEYRKTRLSKKQYVAECSNVIYKIELVKTKNGYEKRTRDTDAEDKAKSKVREFLIKGETPYEFVMCNKVLNNDDYKQSIIDLMQSIRKQGVNTYIVPDLYRKYFLVPDTNYTLVINHYGFYRTKGDLTATTATSVVMGILTLGGLTVAPIAANSYFEYCVIDTSTMKVVMYNLSNIEDDPVGEAVIFAHINQLLDNMIAVGKSNR